ncbi:MAG: DUF2865 domain-containing protein, partial [Pseudomonadota bacterium]
MSSVDVGPRRVGQIRVPFAVMVLGVGIVTAFGMANVEMATPGQTNSAPRSSSAAEFVSEVRVLEGDDWMQEMNGGVFSRYRRSSRSRAVSRPNALDLSRRSRLGRVAPRTRRRIPPGLQRAPKRNAGKTFRTVCVRLCDGYYYPISPSTTRSRFRRDAKACASSCAAPTRLYYQPAAGNASQMVSLDGDKYTKLKTAFLYRASYQPNCQCRAKPWSEQAKKRHQIYALKKERKKKWRDRKRRREIARELKVLRKAIRVATASQRKATKKVTKQVMSSITPAARAERVEQYVTQVTTRENSIRLGAPQLRALSEQQRVKRKRRPRASTSTSTAQVRDTRRTRKAKSRRIKPKMHLGLKPPVRPRRKSAKRPVRQAR